jgi:hypothetical protein
VWMQYDLIGYISVITARLFLFFQRLCYWRGKELFYIMYVRYVMRVNEGGFHELYS